MAGADGRYVLAAPNSVHTGIKAGLFMLISIHKWMHRFLRQMRSFVLPAYPYFGGSGFQVILVV